MIFVEIESTLKRAAVSSLPTTYYMVPHDPLPTADNISEQIDIPIENINHLQMQTNDSNNSNLQSTNINNENSIQPNNIGNQLSQDLRAYRIRNVGKVIVATLNINSVRNKFYELKMTIASNRW